MTHLLTRLDKDHRRLAQLLILLERLLDEFHDGAEPDYELMCELMEYMTDYADQVHHPTEDLIFEHLLASEGEGHSVLRQLMKQHETLSQLNTRFKVSLEGIVREELLRRDIVEQQGRDLIMTLREHMRLEDEEAFPLARERLSAADWQALDEQAPSVDDPVFGKSDPERFRGIYTQLQAESAR